MKRAGDDGLSVPAFYGWVFVTAARWRPRLQETLTRIAVGSDQFTDDWWIIGSAAAAVSGAEIAVVRDVDLLLSERDARRLLDLWKADSHKAAAPDAQFRSSVFARYEAAPLPIEAFGGFQMNIRGQWRDVAPLTREAKGSVFTPSVAEQITLLQAMGRPKDQARIAALQALL